MNIASIVDVIIALVVLLWGLTGFKRGFIKQGVMTIGTIIMFVIAFFLKNPVAEFLSLNLPFFDFTGVLGGPALNILMYQLIAFVIVVLILEVVLNLLIKVSGIIETLLKFTIIFGLPSKILGLILGFIEGIVITYVVLVFISQPIFKLNLLEDSKLTPVILNNVPGLSNITGGMIEVFNDIYELTDTYKDTNNSNGYTLDAIDIMLKHNVISTNYVDKLVDKGKLEVPSLNNVLNKYREEE